MKKSYCVVIILILIVILFTTISGCENKEEKLINELSNSFSITDSNFGKQIKNAYQQYPQNEDISAIYNYYMASYYQQTGNQYDETINYKTYSQLYLRQINSNYKGSMSKEIYCFGISLFGSINEWNSQTEYYNSKYKRLTKDDKKNIIKWIKLRFDYYDKTYGYCVDDRYSQPVFTEASQNFGFLYEEINMLWFEYAVKPYPLNYTVSL